MSYFGDIGKNSEILVDYFKSNGARKCHGKENPAEYLLEVIGSGADWPEIWKNSKERAQIQEELEKISTDELMVDHNNEIPREFSTSFAYQLWNVYKRMNVIWWRSPFYNVGRLLNASYVGLLIGFSFFDLGVSTSDIRSRVFLALTATEISYFFIFSALPPVFSQRVYFRRYTEFSGKKKMKSHFFKKLN